MNDERKDVGAAGDAGADGALVSRVASMTDWDGEPVRAWEGAVRRVGRRRRAWRGGVIGAAACLAVVGVVTVEFGSGFGGAVGTRSGEGSSAMSVEASADADWMGGASVEFEASEPRAIDREVRASVEGGSVGGSRDLGSAGDGRAVVYTDRVTVRVESVLLAFGRVQDVVDGSLGEYVSASSYRSGDRSFSATVTVRVRPERRGEVLLALSELGEVIEQGTTTTDVGGDLVDLRSRLRNERRVEEELLALLSARPDADLEDVLVLQRTLGGVRGSIERLEGRLASLEARVSLAEIRVTLMEEGAKRSADGDAEEGGFVSMMGDALRDGGDALVESVAFLVRVAVGGAVVWFGLIVFGVVVWRLTGRKVPA